MNEITSQRILFPFVGDSIGGSHFSALLLAEGLREQAYEPILGLHQEGPLSEYLDTCQIPWIRLPVTQVENSSLTSQIMQMVARAPALARILRDRKISLVHTNDLRMHMTWVLASRWAGVAHVWHQRTADPSRRNGVYSRFSSAIVTISSYCRDQFPGPLRCRAQVIDNPVNLELDTLDTAAARTQLIAELKAPPEAKIIIFVGALNSQKRPLDFVEIARQVKARVSEPVIFAMFGKTGPLEAEVQEAITAAGLGDVLRWFGVRYPLQPWLRAADIFVAPALNEGLGRAVIEAMLVGTPVVARCSGGHKELIVSGESGLYPTTEDASGFATAVLELLKDPAKAARLAEKARVHATERFNTSSHVMRVADLYERIWAGGSKTKSQPGDNKPDIAGRRL